MPLKKSFFSSTFWSCKLEKNALDGPDKSSFSKRSSQLSGVSLMPFFLSLALSEGSMIFSLAETLVGSCFLIEGFSGSCFLTNSGFFFRVLSDSPENVRHLRTAISKQSLLFPVCFASIKPLVKNW